MRFLWTPAITPCYTPEVCHQRTFQKCIFFEHQNISMLSIILNYQAERPFKGNFFQNNFRERVSLNFKIIRENTEHIAHRGYTVLIYNSSFPIMKKIPKLNYETGTMHGPLNGAKTAFCSRLSSLPFLTGSWRKGMLRVYHQGFHSGHASWPLSAIILFCQLERRFGFQTRRALPCR